MEVFFFGLVGVGSGTCCGFDGYFFVFGFYSTVKWLVGLCVCGRVPINPLMVAFNWGFSSIVWVFGVYVVKLLYLDFCVIYGCEILVDLLVISSFCGVLVVSVLRNRLLFIRTFVCTYVTWRW